MMEVSSTARAVAHVTLPPDAWMSAKFDGAGADTGEPVFHVVVQASGDTPERAAELVRDAATRIGNALLALGREGAP